jgi:hypothetical protein
MAEEGKVVRKHQFLNLILRLCKLMAEDRQHQGFSFIFRPCFRVEAKKNLTMGRIHLGIRNHADSLQDLLCGLVKTPDL